MLEVAYRLKPEHIRAYQRLATKRVHGKGRPLGEAWWRLMVYAALAAALLAVAYETFSDLAGWPFALIAFMTGLVCGIVVSIAMMWWRYSRYSRLAIRPGGPTLSEHHVSVTSEGLRTSSGLFENLYRWPALDAVTVEGSIIVLWIEPGAGVLVPRSAFPDAAAESAFLAAVRGHMAEAGRAAAP